VRAAPRFARLQGGGHDAFAAEEAQRSVKGMEENAVHAKYIELVRHVCVRLTGG
jgi:hypothetical protein